MIDFVCYACLACTDFTNDFADISFGGLGSPEGWTTLVIRTDVGEAIYSEALQYNYIEELEGGKEGSRVDPATRFAKLIEFAERKRKRGLDTLNKLR